MYYCTTGRLLYLALNTRIPGCLPVCCISLTSSAQAIWETTVLSISDPEIGQDPQTYGIVRRSPVSHGTLTVTAASVCKLLFGRRKGWVDGWMDGYVAFASADEKEDLMLVLPILGTIMRVSIT